MDLIPAVVLLVAMCLGMPVAIALGAGALTFFLTADGIPVAAFAQKVQSSFGTGALLAIPLFVLAGALLNLSGVSQRLFALAEALVGNSTGGLAKVNVVLVTLIGGVSASAAADAAMQAKLVGQPMVARGYPRPFAAAVIAASALIDPLIPPGIGFILYGAMTETSVGRLFAAGVVPGLMMCAALLVTVHIVAKRGGYDAARRHAASAISRPVIILGALRRAWVALLMPVFVVLGIRYGLFTPTEAGGVLVVIALVYGFVIYRELRLADIGIALRESIDVTASLMLIVAVSTAFAFYLTWEGMPQQLTRFVLAHVNDKLMIILIVNIVLFVVGTFLEPIPAMIILVPILHPIALRVGIDPVHMGVMVVLNLTIGAITPPIGTVMFLVNSVLGVSVAQFAWASLPFLGALLLVLAAISAVPELCLALPRALY
jgi:tripartite ATP-independent transporter DctM subunit